MQGRNVVLFVYAKNDGGLAQNRQEKSREETDSLAGSESLTSGSTWLKHTAEQVELSLSQTSLTWGILLRQALLRVPWDFLPHF